MLHLRQFVNRWKFDRFWNRHSHRLKTAKKLGDSIHKRDSHENGSWGDAGSGMSLKSLPHSDSSLSLKRFSHSHHTPLVQIRNDPPVKAEFLHIGRNLFCVVALGSNEITGLTCYSFVDGIPLIFFRVLKPRWWQWKMK